MAETTILESQNKTKIDPATGIGRVYYNVADLDRQTAFYRDVLGFKLLWREDDTAALGTEKRELLRLTLVPGARRVRGTTGLYHTAFLVPTRWDLAQLIRQIAVTRTPIQGHSNHGTHLAIYLPDAEGNGIELAWDFPKEVWPMKNGQLHFDMANRGGVDIDELFSELQNDPRAWNGLDPETRIGHVHLHIADIDASRRFYRDLLGFDTTLDSADFGGLFVSAGGYHHHIGMNTWLGTDAPPAPPDAVGLRYYTIALPNQTELDRAVARLEAGGVKTEMTDDGVFVRDPSQNGIVLTLDESK